MMSYTELVVCFRSHVQEK